MSARSEPERPEQGRREREPAHPARVLVPQERVLAPQQQVPEPVHPGRALVQPGAPAAEGRIRPASWPPRR